jgi:plasmid stabilization system protein ParE
MFQMLSARILSLGQQPFKGHEGPAPELRELAMRFGKSGYIVRYQVTEKAVIVLRIWHGREDRPRG